MLPKIFYSWIAFSLIFHCSLSAEDVEFEEVIVEDRIKNADVASDASDQKIIFSKKSSPVVSEQRRAASENGEKTAPKKLKPHYAGARRSPERGKNSEDEKNNPSRIKNKWFSSKTHPKVGKKEEVEVSQEPPAELPIDRPHYTKTSNSLGRPRIASLDLSSDISLESQPMRPQIETEHNSRVCCYPRGGFQAPRGHFFFTGEWLYWRTRQEGMEFATAKKNRF